MYDQSELAAMEEQVVSWLQWEDQIWYQHPLSPSRLTKNLPAPPHQSWSGRYGQFELAAVEEQFSWW